MRILLTGASGYIGKRLLPVLLEQGHTVYACVRLKSTLAVPEQHQDSLHILELDFLNPDHLNRVPKGLDTAFYLMHALGSDTGNFSEKEERLALNFNKSIQNSELKQVVYLGGISNDQNLSDHLKSRKNTESFLKQSGIPLTVLRAAIIIGSGGASFEIIRDLVEKLPFMIAPKWLNTKCQPIAIRNVIHYLEKSIGKESLYNQTFDIGGPDVLSYKQMLLQFAEVRNMKRYILTLPVMTPRLSSYWLYFVTSTAYRLAVNLVDSMKNEVLVERSGINDHIPLELIPYQKAVEQAFKRIEQNMVLSSWIDSDFNLKQDQSFNHLVQVPQHGVFKDQKKVAFSADQLASVQSNIWSIGGNRGWYYGNWLWKVRGQVDKLVGGVGLRRGRRSESEINTGDTLDFWRVILADQEECRLLLYAEMKLPGEAWLEFKIVASDQSPQMVQTATFRPKGVWGRVYWFSMLPFHGFIFKNMAKNLVHYSFEK